MVLLLLDDRVSRLRLLRCRVSSAMTLSREKLVLRLMYFVTAPESYLPKNAVIIYSRSLSFRFSSLVRLVASESYRVSFGKCCGGS